MSDLNPEDLAIKEENKEDFKQSVITRSNLTNEFTVADIETHLVTLNKMKKEADANVSLAKSMLANIEKNHKKLIDSLSPEKIATVWLWQENQNMVKEITPQQKDINKEVEKHEDYLSTIYETFGFVETEVPEVNEDNNEQPKINRDNPSGTAKGG